MTSKDPTKIVRIHKIDKVAPDHRGRSVWLGKIEPVELELVSTTALEKILKTERRRNAQRDPEARRRPQEWPARARHGDRPLPHPFRPDLRNAAKAPPPGDGPKRSGAVTAASLTKTTRMKADELSLVSTQILRKVVKPDEAEAGKSRQGPRKDKSGGFNPYDNN